MRSGVYGILNLKTGKWYIGSTFHFRRRKNSHFSMLNRGKHHSRKLQNSWNKYSGCGFIFLIIRCYEIKILPIAEYYWMTKFDSFENGYNSYPFSGGNPQRNIGRKRTDETKRRMSESKKGRKFTDEHRRKLSASRHGIQISDATKAKMRAAKIGIKLTETHKKNISKGRRLLID